MTDPHKVPQGVQRSLERQRVYGQRPERRKAQKPELVVFTLQSLHAPEVHFPGSPHPAQVVTPAGEIVAELKAGEAAVFVGEVLEEAVEATETDPGKPAVVAWSRKSAH